MSDTTVDATATTTETTTEPSSGKTTEWYESELTKVRGEAAKYRNEKKDAVKAAKDEVTAEWEAKFNQANADLDRSNLDNTKLRAALPEDQAETVVKFASLLQGTTPEEIEAHAKEVRSLFGANTSRVPAVDPTPAGKAIPLNGDPLEDALKAALGIN